MLSGGGSWVGSSGGGGGASSSFTTIQPDSGTSPTATSATDTLTLTSANAGLVVSGNSGTNTITFTLDADLAAIGALSSTGILARTASNTWAQRTLTGTAAEITVTNGDGVSGNPTLSLPTALTFTGKTVTGGTFASPTFTTPVLGTPSSGTLTSCTGLPVSSGISGLGTGVAAFLATPSSANLLSALTDKTGSGVNVFANTPTLITPVLGVATATSINKVAITAPATSSTLTVADGKTLTISNTLTFTGTDSSSVNFGAGGTVIYAARELLVADRNYYVRTDGSDSNTGLANTSGAAFLTVQKAINVACGLDLGIYQVNINIANGTYTGAITATPYAGTGPINIIGDTSWTDASSGSPGVVFAVTSNTAFNQSGVGKYTIKGVKITTTTTGHHIGMSNRCTLDLALVEFGAIASGYASLSISTNSILNFSNSFRHTAGGTPDSFLNLTKGSITGVSAVISMYMTGSPAWGTAMIISSRAAFSDAWNIVTITEQSGSATGKRYQVDLLSAIRTNGAGITFFPGNSVGTADATTYGVYT